MFSTCRTTASGKPGYESIIEVVHKVTGQKDPVIELLRELTSEDGRRRTGRFFAEGEEMVRRAFDYGARIESVILADRFASTPEARGLIERSASADAQVHTATGGLLAKILQAKPTPECLAVVERKVASLADVFASKRPLIQMVENCENADNLGMLLRSTDAAGVDGVILAGDTTDPFARRVVRGSRGAVLTVPICIQPKSAKAIEEAKKSDLQVVATSANSDIPYTDIDYTGPTMIVVGSEHTGISDVVREMSGAVVGIPMLGKINSLNVAVAASVMLYEAVRQRIRRER